MGLIGSLIGIGLGAAAIQGMAGFDDTRRGWMNSEEAKRFDQLNARDGIRTERVVDIARRCHVKTNKYGVIPSDGYHQCLAYVRKYANSENDIDKFITNWKNVFEKQLEDLPNKIKESKDAKDYPDIERTLEKYVLTNDTLTYEVTHWLNLPKDKHLKRMNDISKNTIMKEFLYQPPVLRWSDKVHNAYTEFWTVYVPDNPWHLFRNQKHFNYVYKVCAAHLGYDAEL